MLRIRYHTLNFQVVSKITQLYPWLSNSTSWKTIMIKAPHPVESSSHILIMGFLEGKMGKGTGCKRNYMERHKTHGFWFKSPSLINNASLPRNKGRPSPSPEGWKLVLLLLQEMGGQVAGCYSWEQWPRGSHNSSLLFLRAVGMGRSHFIACKCFSLKKSVGHKLSNLFESTVGFHFTYL